MPGALPPKIVPRVQQLIRLLGTDNDGEALNAVRALGRTLAKEGKSFHDLAEAVETGPAWLGPPKLKPAPPESPTWESLRDFERRDWLSLFSRKLEINDKGEKAKLAQFRQQMLKAESMSWEPSRQQLLLFASLMARAWAFGLRP